MNTNKKIAVAVLALVALAGFGYAGSAAFTLVKNQQASVMLAQVTPGQGMVTVPSRTSSIVGNPSGSIPVLPPTDNARRTSLPTPTINPSPTGTAKITCPDCSQLEKRVKEAQKKINDTVQRLIDAESELSAHTAKLELRLFKADFDQLQKQLEECNKLKAIYCAGFEAGQNSPKGSSPLPKTTPTPRR